MMAREIKVVFDKNALKNMPALIQARLGRAVAKAARDVEGQAKARVPVDTGALKNSIQARQLEALSWEVEAGQHYAAFVEFGTVKMAAQPYLTPAAEAVRPALERAVAQAVEEAARSA